MGGTTETAQRRNQIEARNKLPRNASLPLVSESQRPPGGPSGPPLRLTEQKGGAGWSARGTAASRGRALRPKGDSRGRDQGAATGARLFLFYGNELPSCLLSLSAVLSFPFWAALSSSPALPLGYVFSSSLALPRLPRLLSTRRTRGGAAIACTRGWPPLALKIQSEVRVGRSLLISLVDPGGPLVRSHVRSFRERHGILACQRVASLPVRSHRRVPSEREWANSARRAACLIRRPLCRQVGRETKSRKERSERSEGSRKSETSRRQGGLMSLTCVQFDTSIRLDNSARQEALSTNGMRINPRSWRCGLITSCSP